MKGHVNMIVKKKKKRSHLTNEDGIAPRGVTLYTFLYVENSYMV